MCVVCCKYIQGTGWILAKNRDRNYKPNILIRKSFRRDIERLYIWDENTKYTEGVNQFGVAIISASVTVKDDEAEGSVAARRNKKKLEIRNRTYYSPDGFRIRTALFEKNSTDATRKLIELQIPGNTIIADKNDCFLLEGAFTEDDEYVYKVIEVPRDRVAVRTNHGILLPWTGYNPEIPEQKESRESSDKRYDVVVKKLLYAKSIDEVIDAISDTSNENPQLNPLRMDLRRGKMRTTGQIILVPSENTMHYRAIWSGTSFDLDKLNTNDNKTFFEIVSTRKLITFKEYFK